MLGLVQLLILAEVVSCCIQHGFCDKKRLLKRMKAKYDCSEQQSRMTLARLTDRGLIKGSNSGVGYVVVAKEEIDAILWRGRRLCRDILELLDREVGND